MTAKDVIRHSLQLCHSVLTSYLSDLTDADLMVRPVPGANHTAWMLGHVLICENGLKELGYAMPALPEGFAASYGKEMAGCDDPARFHRKDQYVQWLKEQRDATLAHLDALPDAELDKPGPEEARDYAPTVGAMFNAVGIHDMMHAPQIAVVRRKLGKPPLF